MAIYSDSYDFNINGKLEFDPVQLEVKMEIEQHMIMHTEENPNQYSHCGKNVIQIDDQSDHQSAHTREKTHQCNQCDNCFTLKSDLVIHQRTHTGEKPFQCSQCETFFALKDELIVHLRAHTFDKLLQCSNCNIWFEQQYRTIHTATGEKPHQSIYCDKCLAQKGYQVGNQTTPQKKYKTYSLEEKEIIADLVEKYKDEYEKKVAENKKLPKHWDAKRKKFVVPFVKEGYLARAVRELYPSLANVSNENPEFKRARAVAHRCLESRVQKRKRGEEISTGSESLNRKPRSRQPGGGRKTRALEVRYAAFDWFVDIRGTLKGNLPIKLFKAKCKELYELWMENQAKEIKAEEQLKFSNKWVRDWMKEYNVSLSKPNKRFAISQEDKVLRITEFLKNIMRIRHYFQVHFKREPVIISGDQMPLHRNEMILNEKTGMMEENHTEYVKEYHTISRERATVYTQLSTESQHTMPTPEILFKGKYEGIQMNSPNMTVQCAPKGSYRMENILKTMKTLKNRNNIHTQKDYAIYILDDYSVHLQDKLREFLLQQGYVLVIIGGGISGDIQINDTHLHHQLKSIYREKESELMKQKLRSYPINFSPPTREEMIHMLLESWGILKIDPVIALKNNFVLNAFDGSEDYLVNDKLMKLVGDEIKVFRKELLSSPPPQLIQEMIKTITPPRGDKMKRKTAQGVPPDEGRELMDCEGDEIPLGEEETIANEEEVEEPIQLSSHVHEALNSPPTDTRAPDQPANPPDLPANPPDLPANLPDLPANPPDLPANSPDLPANPPNLPANPPDCLINADSIFLKDISDVLQKHLGQTSEHILPYYCQFLDTLTKAKCSLKKNEASNSSLT